MKNYDYVIVGGGSAGCVLAARLTELPDVRVLLLEAGPTDTEPYIHMPVGFSKLTAGPLTWGYTTAPQKHCYNREIVYAQGRVIGGSSSINAQIYTRGAREDYDRWANEEGCPGWSFDEVKPLFVRAEDNDTFADDLHGVGGPLGVSQLAPQMLTRTFVRACQQAGIPYNADFNGAKQAGSGVYQTTIRGGKRCSAAVGYLNPARSRPNLEVMTDCRTTKIIVEQGRAVGVRFLQANNEREVRANREILLTAGAIGSPKLLMLSGIGPADELRALGIQVAHDLQGVGRNLHDHYGTDVIYELNDQVSFDRYKKWHWMMWAGLEYKLFGKGPVASNIVEGGAFWFAERDAPVPDMQFHFLVGAGVEAGVAAVPSGAGVTMNNYCLRPRSRGSVTLRSSDPAAAPVIDPNYLAEPYDLRVSVEGLKKMREIMAQPAFAKLVRRAHHPADIRSDQEAQEFLRRSGRTSYHPVGTCKMGQDELAVVDPQLRVRGIEGLRVCDASIMPSMIGSNTNAPTIMIGEKASDLIRGNRKAA
ncbi:MAG TPA: GMC family oxidoreductase N-terminal domain-containing protein [Geminicoccus sp.]|uniref:GMC family oxidoreductase n=1 Tax=Geminicoccus sp. TaxID=2024832 RepID=UPI002E3158E5|nr:GMC family oxidoreductase N-terminal domain-containing protein [Geminicoccus sp.]HEX2528137.1 GMC family oxidoreductase N-terminal domain-containing protein [Geminicoccus sp.]